ncbi:MAG: Gfo/Idh/MocA family oxidoreductase [Sedimentisphaerales bacterium]|jgi:predicted dehydrogenase|nr:Gfo/Idh/MocA family oxidoreductase [Sedimentisphaerales bacterium]HNY78653.1 Gfo/Idh/MocA family oxidoreductase [Sedimentisphaerales bacterium]HOC64317.1 Gfo/Idh/MocA family oxidoreductase [Sedimentisphaerales bacterium]HOH64635.1 Gfo/Idh/MocA family oxidoreductase [Sedimentisphaerales bacterium]HQN34559.1 Gfo/Idh/MocA family oxidoreductase [Sedimentisphaerales bacterium]
MSTRIDRRTFLKTSAAVGAGVTILKSGILKAGSSPNEKLNIAVIGVRGRGHANLNGVKEENIVALCDVNEKNLAEAAQEFPQAKTYVDWRKCLDQKDIDAVVCSTTDHTHAFVNVWAMNRGKHVYCEKPLANSVHEAHVVRQTYLKNKGKLATQMGTQIHASDNYRRMVELVRRGAIGDVKKVHVWCSRTPEGGSYLPAAGPVPEHLHWDLWIGPAPEHPYNPGYFGGCLAWNRFWDFGSGQIGDMGSHMMDMAYWALDLRLPTTCQAEGSPLNPDTCPQWLTAEWDHPANDWRPAVKVYWYDGGKKPGMPSEAFNREKLFKGVLFQGEKGWLLCDYDFRILMPMGDLTHFDCPKTGDLIPPSPGHHQEWIIGCKTGKPPLCNFDYSGALLENNLLALVAYRLGQKLDWDAENLKATGCPEADQYIRKQYRQGWNLNG